MRASSRRRARYRPLRVDGRVAGWLDDARLARLAAWSDVFESRWRCVFASSRGLADADARTRALERVARTLAAEGLLTAWRDERYAVAPEFGAPPWFLLERAAARYFGMHTYAAHVNGLVRRGDDIAMWIARRSPTKSIDPAMLDNLVGGGIAAGQSVASTVIKEAWEEAGIPRAPRHAGGARGHGAPLPRATGRPAARDDLRPRPVAARRFHSGCQDGEVVDHRLVPLRDVGALIANETGPDVVTADASLVIVDCLLRHGMIAADAPDSFALEALRHPTARGWPRLNAGR